MSDLKVYLHIHGVFGSGKTAFGLTGPAPRLVADVEGAAFKSKYGGTKVLWDDWDQDVSNVLTDVETVVYPIKSEDDLKFLYWLKPYKMFLEAVHQHKGLLFSADINFEGSKHCNFYIKTFCMIFCFYCFSFVSSVQPM